jgi:hypothetical protein
VVLLPIGHGALAFFCSVLLLKFNVYHEIQLLENFSPSLIILSQRLRFYLGGPVQID